MRKLTSFFVMTLLCCIGAFAQETVGTEIPKNSLVKIGTAQSEMVPGKWYFLHNPRKPGNVPAALEDFRLPGETIASAGGIVTDNGEGKVYMSVTNVIDELSNEEGVNLQEHLNHIVRFVEVEGEEGAYNIQFGTGLWIQHTSSQQSTVLSTCSTNMWLAGQAGKYNFYLIKMVEDDNRPNTAGRFGWNNYNMQNRVDNNAAGSTVVFWADGEVTSAQLTTDNITEDENLFGNKVWQIYDIEIVGQMSPQRLYEEAFNRFLAKYTEYATLEDGMFIENLTNGVNVGDSYGNYRQENVDAFLAKHAAIEALIDEAEASGIDFLMEQYPTPDDLDALTAEYTALYTALIENRIPLALTNVTPGYYTLINAQIDFWYETKTTDIYYTQEEADAYNAEMGLTEEDEDFKTTESVKETESEQVYGPVKALCARDASNGTWMAWGELDSTPDYLWKVESVEGKPTEYRLINVRSGGTFVSIGTSANAKCEDTNPNTTVTFDYRDRGMVTNGKDTLESNIINIRSTSQAENGANYLHCGGHASGAGKQGWAVGWYGDPGCSRWFLNPIDEATAQEWINGPAAQLRAMIAKADSIAAAAPGQIRIAEDIVTNIFEDDSVVVDASQFYSQYSTNDAQAIPDGQTVYNFLIDGQQSTYWHSQWENGNAQFKVHYLQIEANETLEGLYAAKITRRPVSGDHITMLAVKGYVDAPTDATTFEEGQDLATLELPLTSNSETLVSAVFDATGCNYLRFYSLETKAAANGGGSARGYWHASEFNVFKAESHKRYETTQYDVRKAQADALAAAVEAWLAGEYDDKNVDLLYDADFLAAYNAIINAGEAWGNVFVDPSDLRQEIANAPAEDLFVKGTNPGEWGEGAETPAAAVAAAEAYDATGTYTAEQSAAHIKAIQDAKNNVFASANKVKTDKWYRFSFPTEEAYEKYGWAKTGAQDAVNAATGAVVSPALFGKTIAAGASQIVYVDYTNANGKADTLTTYTARELEELYAGTKLMYFEDADFSNGEDLFRFIPANDTAYIIQNKATGLFVNVASGRQVSLNAIPTYFEQSAIGAGANLLKYTTVLGTTFDQHAYLHGQRSDNQLVVWNASALGSNSMLMIQEAEDFTEAPSNTYEQRLWPGSYYAYTMPVDITVGEGAQAYGASLTVAEDGGAVVNLQPIEAEVIKAGAPFILVADLDGEYKTIAQAQKEIASETLAEYGQFGKNEKLIADEELLARYAIVEMTHGMTVDTVATQTGKNLVGTFKTVTIEAGKGILPNANGFKHVFANTNLGANSAYITCDFDPEGEDILKAIQIEIGNGIEDGINDVLGKVSQAGNIYTVGGQLVGKGNINTVSKLPAGVYIVNGVKVTKN